MPQNNQFLYQSKSGCLLEYSKNFDSKIADLYPKYAWQMKVWWTDHQSPKSPRFLLLKFFTVYYLNHE